MPPFDLQPPSSYNFWAHYESTLFGILMETTRGKLEKTERAQIDTGR